MLHRYQLEEGVKHGTAELPISIYYTSLPGNTENILYLHWHHEFEFLTVTKGGARFHIEDKSYDVYENEGIFIPPNTLHSATSLGGLPCAYHALVFHSSFIAGDYDSHNYARYVKPIVSGKVILSAHYSTQVPWQRDVLSLLSDISGYYGRELKEWELLIKSRIYELWHLLLKHPLSVAPDSKEVAEENCFKPIMEYLHTHYQENVSLRTLADLIPISESQFCRSFRAEFGITPFEYLIRYRILKSCSLLANTDEKVSAIANQVGFNNISYFNRSFRSMINCTPSEYRKNVSSK